MLRVTARALVLGSVLIVAGCQSPTSSDSTTSVDDFVTASISPNPPTATDSTGKTYRVVRGNNQPDEILPFMYVTSFSVTVTITTNPDNVGLTFPVTITAATGKVEQASGGIVTPPTGGEVEHYESIITQSSGTTFGAVNSSVTLGFQAWYALPNGRREALVTESIALKDNNGKTFTKEVKVQIAP